MSAEGWSYGNSTRTRVTTLPTGTGVDKQFASIVTAIEVGKVAIEDHREIAQLLVSALPGIEQVDDVGGLIDLRIGDIDASGIEPCAHDDAIIRWR